MKANEHQVHKYELQNIEEMVSIEDANSSVPRIVQPEHSRPQHNSRGRLGGMSCICYLLLCNKLPQDLAD